MLLQNQFLLPNYVNVPTKILLCLHVPKTSAFLACLTMSKLKMNRHVPNKNTDLLKKIRLMGTKNHVQFVKLQKPCAFC